MPIRCRDVGLLQQLPALIGVVIGPLGSYLAVTLAAELGRSTAYMQQLAYRMHWHDRAKAYDVDQRRQEAGTLDAARRSHAK
ncbi:hypothetical protein [Streptomyces luteolus]|uniref:Uncharacterized protein n=1 Tax=Streptomyces luteolus TaxID=3043615 RepID=A0ABT6SYG8_9ACTN|nr:hypothetical protein [Streptomyces sp. B-S-A12]MDI3420662.1 hypothetical protein [Streptomyces sp. B-S-A12]